MSVQVALRDSCGEAVQFGNGSGQASGADGSVCRNDEDWRPVQRHAGQGGADRVHAERGPVRESEAQRAAGERRDRKGSGGPSRDVEADLEQGRTATDDAMRSIGDALRAVTDRVGEGAKVVGSGIQTVADGAPKATAAVVGIASAALAFRGAKALWRIGRGRNRHRPRHAGRTRWPVGGRPNQWCTRGGGPLLTRAQTTCRPPERQVGYYMGRLLHMEGRDVDNPSAAKDTTNSVAGGCRAWLNSRCLASRARSGYLVAAIGFGIL